MYDTNYTSYCCNGDTNFTSCNDKSINCKIDKSNFINKAKTTTISDPTSLSEFCSLGKKITDNNCMVDSSYPINNKIYVDSCCNGSYNKDDCGNKGQTCISDATAFKSEDVTKIGWNINNYKVGQPYIKEYCDLGKKNNKCYM